MKLRGQVVFSALLALAVGPLPAQQTSTTLVTPQDVGARSLLPTSFGEWTTASAESTEPEPKMSLVNASKAALQEDNPQRSQTATYQGPGGRAMRVEAVQFADYTGAWSAYTLVREPGLRDAKDVGAFDAVGKDEVLFQSGAVVVVAYPASAADVPALKALDVSLPKVHGSQAQPPLLPAFLPAKGLVQGSVRYAIGQSGYAAEGGVLPSGGLGWDKSAEAITASYKDKRGDETLTLLVYPTPQIAEAHLKAINNLLPNLGPKFAQARARKEAELVILANGSFSPEAAQAFVNDIHMKQLASNDLATTGQPEFHSEMRKTYSLLSNIMLLFSVLGAGAVLLGLFLGGGRAIVRKLRGKDAATEAEFLSLHLAAQNAAPHWNPSEPAR